jgi:hypothetical protein
MLCAGEGVTHVTDGKLPEASTFWKSAEVKSCTFGVLAVD